MTTTFAAKDGFQLQARVVDICPNTETLARYYTSSNSYLLSCPFFGNKDSMAASNTLFNEFLASYDITFPDSQSLLEQVLGIIATEVQSQDFDVWYDCLQPLVNLEQYKIYLLLTWESMN